MYQSYSKPKAGRFLRHGVNTLNLLCRLVITRMWANAQPDGRPAEHRWCPLFNAAKFGGRPLLHRVSKNVPPLDCYNFDAHKCILIFLAEMLPI